ncbi:hypothetical protein [Vibrio rumoiensis]|uniref:Uncharacterized protein n=1 Tax=Vibrio rumoiensis TaxID=76258 RepID=A0ABW7IZV6_9VIBR
MTIHIPEWILWLVGIPFGVLVLALALLGLYVFNSLPKGGR